MKICYVLSSRAHFHLHPREIQARLQPVVTVKGLKLPSRRRLLRALEVYAGYPSLDFEDALIAAQVEQDGISTLVSYDRGFDKLGWITRVEPQTAVDKTKPINRLQMLYLELIGRTQFSRLRASRSPLIWPNTWSCGRPS